jgi:hypothetical protein
MTDQSKSVMGATSEVQPTEPTVSLQSVEPSDGIVEKSLKALKEEAIALGFPEDALKSIGSRPSVQAIIDTIKKGSSAKAPTEKVETIEEKPNPAEEKQVEKILNSRKGIIFRKLESQPQVPLFIPKQDEQPEGVVKTIMRRGIREYIHVGGSVQHFTINGYTVIVPKGVETLVPMQIHQMWSDSQMRTQRAGQEFSENRIDPRTGNPFKNRL